MKKDNLAKSDLQERQQKTIQTDYSLKPPFPKEF